MPELPDVTVYVERIAAKILERKLERVRIANVFILRSVDPPITEVEGRTVRDVRRIGKRIAIGLDDDLWIVIHLMIAGRFRWLKPGAEPLEIDRGTFAERLTRENHTLKRSFTDPRLFSGIGNAYSDEIFHRARISPIKLTSRLTPEEITSLYDATREVLTEWTDRLRKEAGDEFPAKVTALAARPGGCLPIVHFPDY